MSFTQIFKVILIILNEAWIHKFDHSEYIVRETVRYKKVVCYLELHWEFYLVPFIIGLNGVVLQIHIHKDFLCVRL